jgi:TolA-binding protein
MDKSHTIYETAFATESKPESVHSLSPQSDSRPSSDISIRYQQALAFHQQSHFCEAETLYREILDADPNHPGALHFLGVSRFSQGYPAEAIPFPFCCKSFFVFHAI